jgi:hypothetical protein
LGSFGGTGALDEGMASLGDGPASDTRCWRCVRLGGEPVVPGRLAEQARALRSELLPLGCGVAGRGRGFRPAAVDAPALPSAG